MATITYGETAVTSTARADRGDGGRVHPRGGARLAPGEPRGGVLRREPRVLGDRLRLAAGDVRARLVGDDHGERARPRARHADHRAAGAARPAHRDEQHGLQRRALRRHRPAGRLGADAGFALAYAAIAVWTSGDALVASRAPPARHARRRRRARGRLRADRGRDRARRALRPRDRRRAAEDRRAGRRRAAAAGVFAFAADFHAGGGGEYLLGGFWPTWALAVTVAAAGPLSYAPSLGDYTRRISRTHGDRKVLAAAALGVFGGLLATTLFGAFTALTFTDLGASYVADLVAAAPAWYVLPILVIGLAGGVGQGVLNLYASGLDLEAIIPRARARPHDADHALVAIALRLPRARSRSTRSTRSRR